MTSRVLSAAATATWERVRQLSVEVLVVTAGIVTYFGIRGATAGSPEVAVDHAHDIVELQNLLGLDHEDWLQAQVVGSDTLTTFFNWVYIWGHWPVIVVTLGWLAWRHRTMYLRLRNAMLLSGGLGLCVYTTYPVAPPRLAGLGFVDTVTEQSHAYRVLQPPAFVNQYAAMPSLHVGWDLLVGLVIASAAGALWLRTVGRLMPVLMALATVATANHYVLDVLGGAAFGLAGLAGAMWLERRRERRAGVAGPLPPGAVPSPRPAAEPADRPRATRPADGRCGR